MCGLLVVLCGVNCVDFPFFHSRVYLAVCKEPANRGLVVQQGGVKVIANVLPISI